MAAPLSRNGYKTIPTIWAERILKRDFEIALGKMLQPSQKNPDETEESYLRSANVQWVGVDISDLKTMWFSPEDREQLLLQTGDLLVNEGGDAGRCAIWKGELSPCYFQNAINRVRPRRNASARFLYYWLRNLKDAGFIDAIAGRTTIAHLTAEKLEGLPWPDIPITEQEQIATFLDKSYAAIGAAAILKNSQLETLDKLVKATISRVVTTGDASSPVLDATGNDWLPAIPRGWDLIALKRVCEIQTGLTLGKEYYEACVNRPYLRVANVQDGYLSLEEVSTIDVPDEVAAGVELRAGDVLMTEGGDLDKLGRGYLWEGQIKGCLHQNHIFAVRVFPHKLVPRFLTYLTASQYGRAYFEATGKRTTNLACTNATKVGAFPIPLPRVSEQQRLVAFLDSRVSQIQRARESIESQIATLELYRKSLTHECVTGQHRVTKAALKFVGVYA